MKNQVNITISGIGFNCEVAARFTEDEFVNKHMPTKLPNTPIREREIILRQAHQYCLKKLDDINGKPAEIQAPEDNGQGSGEVSPDDKVPAGAQTGTGDGSEGGQQPAGDDPGTTASTTGKGKQTGSKQKDKDK